MLPLQTRADTDLLDTLRRDGPMSVPMLEGRLGVTATAVRQRLTRLQEQGLIRRQAVKNGRGRPQHLYSLSEKAKIHGGNTLPELALALWDEVARLEPAELRHALLRRVFDRLAEEYREELDAAGLPASPDGLRQVLADRGIPLEVGHEDGLPVLRTSQCPFPTLADHDPHVCELEAELYSGVLGQKVRLSQCRRDGHACCQFVSES